MSKQRSYQFGASSLVLCFGDITESLAQAIVSSDDGYLSMSGGVSAAIRRAAGSSIALDAVKKVPAETGDVVVTHAGALPAQYVFHAITLSRERTSEQHREIIRKTTQRCLRLLDALNLTSIAFPAIGAGTAGFPYEDVAVEMASVISSDLLERKRPIHVTLFLFDCSRELQPIDFFRFYEEFALRVPRMASHEVVSVSPEPQKPQEDHTDEDLEKKRLTHLRRLLVTLEEQRCKLENSLVAILGGGPENAQEIRGSLKQNEEVRLAYLGEIKALTRSPQKPDAPVVTNLPRTVFVSSTFRDLERHRTAIKDKIARRDLLFRGMEHFGADPNNQLPAKLIVEAVRNADVYIGVFGVRYGSIDPATGVSMTELEFNEAEAGGKPMLLYVIHQDAPVQVSDIEPTSEGKALLDKLKQRILNRYTVYLFRNTEELAGQVFEDLGKMATAHKSAVAR